MSAEHKPKRSVHCFPEAIKPLTGSAAEQFIEYDKRPLTLEEQKSLEEADEVYRKSRLRSREN